MPKTAGTYVYKDSRDPSDSFDRFERPDYEPRDKNGGSAERGQPFTEDEIDAYLDGGGAITICPTPVQPEPKSPGLTKAQIAWAEDFHPLVGIWDAVDACRRHLDIIRPTRPQNAPRRLRAREIVKGVLQGWTFADLAVELSLDKGFLSRKVTEICAEYPELERGLIFVNLLNNQAKRHKQSTPWGFQLQGGAENSDGADGSTSDQVSPYNPAHVKLAELYQRAFPQPRSNYGTMVAKYFDEAPSKGAQRIEHVQRDRWGYELGTDDYRVKIAGHRDNARQRNAVYQWRRLCQFAGLKDDEPVGPEHEWLLKLVAEEFFRAEARLRKANRVVLVELMESPASLHDAPWINPGYLVPTGAVDHQPKVKAPYVPFVNEHKDDKLKKGRGKYNTRRGVPTLCGGVGPWRPGEDVVGHWWAPQPKTFNWPRKNLKPTSKRTKRWETRVHNHTKYGHDANARLRKDVGHLAKHNPRLAERFARLQPSPSNPFNTLGTRISKLIAGVHYIKREADYVERDMIATNPHCYVNAQAVKSLGLSQQLFEWPILMPSTHLDSNVLFDRPVTAIANKQPMETNTNE